MLEFEVLVGAGPASVSRDQKRKHRFLDRIACLGLDLYSPGAKVSHVLGSQGTLDRISHRLKLDALVGEASHYRVKDAADEVLMAREAVPAAPSAAPGRLRRKRLKAGSPLDSQHPESAETREQAEGFLGWVASAHMETFPAVGEGEDVRLTATCLTGAALVAGGRIIHLSAFRSPAEIDRHDGEVRDGARLRPPSARRRHWGTPSED